ncbi:hypothetical protein EYF80_046357 [Liparis tanakae]|uniref:Uncharacterized protein n=1 Tax=Liparis tanakae TaxID=230148 RepID=A0A4Z2FQK8_9TELE|nr:hypothetical protein EYF80_046357 [Liparis tanakae]
MPAELRPRQAGDRGLFDDEPEGHGGDELLHLVGQPLLPRLLVLLQGRGDLEGRKDDGHLSATNYDYYHALQELHATAVLRY